MLKVAVCIKRKAGMAPEPFQEYWRSRHAEVVSRLPGLRRYVQSHARLSGYSKGELVHDGIAELWFDDLAALKHLAGTQEYRDLEEDEAKFIDRSAMVLMLLDEHVILDGEIPDGAVKNVEFVTRRPGLEVEDFQRYWREVHGPLAAHISQIRRYVQSHVRPGAYPSGRAPRYDGLAITWFDDTDAMRASARSEAYRATRADEPNFLPDEAIPLIISTEHVIVEGG